MIIDVKAKFACDDCGTEFVVSLDPAYEPPAGWSVFAVAEDAVRSGNGYEDGQEEAKPWDHSSVLEERHLCARCTRTHDQERTNP